jgi:peptidyl-tRNA hydrolase
MDYRRVFIIRKDLNLSPGKLAAMVGHCSEAYWTNMIRNGTHSSWIGTYMSGEVREWYTCAITIDKDIVDNYINGIFTKTICEARNKTHLLKAKKIAEELGLVEGEQYGEINDCCKTELTPENEDGTTLVGIWFAPLPDDVAHKISKKYQLYH